MYCDLTTIKNAYLIHVLTQVPELFSRISQAYNTSKKKKKNEMTAEEFTIICHNM